MAARKPAPKAVPPPPPSRAQSPVRKVGQPQHVPTEANQARVTAWSGGGIEYAMIAASIPNPTAEKPGKVGISIPTLKKHYKAELLIGKAMMDGLAISALGSAMQRGGKEAVVAAKWWTQSRMGWSEHIVVDEGKKSDQPMRVIVELVGEAAAPRTDQSEPRSGSRLPDDIRNNVQLVG